MHNGQVGGFDRFRKQADMLIREDFYNARRGSTDSEAIFLHALGLGLEENPLEAMAHAVRDLQTLSEQVGKGPHLRFSAAFSDGERLYAVRYASDNRAPSLYYRYFDDAAGFMVVSEPLDGAVSDWNAVPAGTALVFDAGEVTISPFLPMQLSQAA